MLISEIVKVAGYKRINAQKSLASLLHITKKTGKRRIPFTITTEGIEHLGINLPKQAKDLYSEN